MASSVKLVSTILLLVVTALCPVTINRVESNYDTKKFDYTALADRHRTFSQSNYSHPTGVVNWISAPTFQL